MFLSFLVSSPALGTAAAFVVGGAAGVVLARVARLQRAAGSLSLVRGAVQGALTPPPAVGETISRAGHIVPDNSRLATRVRTGRLPLPQRVTDLTPAKEPGLAFVNVFVDRLAELPIDAWLDVGRRQIAGAATAPERATAFAILDATIGSEGLGIAAWYVRDAVETSAFLASNCVTRWTTRDRRVFAAAHAAAEDAALALLTRDRLPRADFATLIAPFEQVLSSDDMTRLSLVRDDRSEQAAARGHSHGAS